MNHSPEASLARAILYRAIRDASHFSEAARDWVETPSWERTFWCEAAGIDPEQLERALDAEGAARGST